ncbi:uncharacterized protein N0V89_003140 [Didymosphaeria variabile]|uniref:Phosphatidic acid phosphatase type 2/haloperoxidase domain-containing protein n=1 Tax=Didymosphaeria variabile TaxID=1932322 RepID=A0A9W8XTU4_9PLEO|nr:uncharacterized protein N0V89_003140 [Didymosphaeria variabile]KAJ4358556.1 hypothetical protein N0V89_003140 [Didymosphaeria variabile]
MIVDKIEPFHQPFAIENWTLHYPYAKKERVTVTMAAIFAVGFPIVIITFYTMIIDGLFSHQTAMPTGRGGVKRLTGRYRLKDRLWELNCGILGLMLSVGAAFTITGALKNAIGKPRPDIVDRCQLKDEVLKRFAEDKSRIILATVADCMQKDNYILQDGFKSFPSAHSSVSFGGLFYLSIYLAAKLHVLDSKGEVWKSFIVLVPTLGAALIAGSRIMDARHHPFDVLSGSLMGILVAWGSYRQYFPPVSETWRKGRAYPIRAWGKGPAMPPPTVDIAEDIQPLRPVRSATDEERGTSSAIPEADEHGGNVFRQQISQSQRRRQEEFGGIRPSDTISSTYSSKVAGYQGQLPASNPFASSSLRQHDNYEYSSSEDDENIELQHQYSLSGRPLAGQHGASYDPVAGQLTDTGYHPAQAVTPTPTPPPTQQRPTGDISEATSAPPPPPHAIGTTAQQV